MGLTHEQKAILAKVIEGHNLVITGQGGTGKSYLIEQILHHLKRIGKEVAVVCSSGLSCTVYERGVAATVHSHYGMQTADLPWKLVVERAGMDSLVVQRIKKANIVIWDEVSMSSARILKISNALEHYLSPQHAKMRPFGGKQFILVGDFFQLKPVPSLFDDGLYAFSAKIYEVAFPHRFELTIIQRQSEADRKFLSLLRELRYGRCSDNSLNFVKSLERNLDAAVSERAIHIFFTKLPVLMHNITVLRNMPGDLIEIKAEKKGEIRGIACPAENVVYLKNGCKVMLLWNKSDQLRNGSQGVFVRMDGLHACVNFSEVGLVRIGKETWVKRDSQGSITGSITQLPLATAYALTCHKSQGQTFDAAVVHSSQEFVSGLHYVALSRVRSSKNLQLVNFKRKYLTPVPSIVTRNEGSSVSEVTREDLSCCRFQEVADLALFYATDKNNAVEISICREEDTDDNDQEIQGTLSSFFENDKEIPPINLALVNETLRVHEGELSQPPADFLSDTSLFQVLSSMKSQSTTTLATEKNRTIEKLVGLDNNHKEILRAFVNVIWYNLFDMLDSHTAVNLDNTIAGCISRQQFTATTGNIHNFLQSKEYKGYVKYLFRNEAPQITKAQTLFASELVFIIYTRFLDILSERVRQESDEENVDCSVWDMPAEGQGKVRYVGGWVLKKVIERGRTYVKENMTSKQEGILKKVKQQLEKASLVQNELVAQPDVLCNSSQYRKTLELTEFRQHRERGLFNITDKAFEFFMQLEQVRSQTINLHRLKRSGTAMIDEAMEQIKDNKDLRDKWFNCFDDHSPELKDLKSEVFEEVVIRNVKMGGNQFLRDFRLQHNVEKSAALRTRVLQRQNDVKQKNDMVKFQDILEDNTRGKSRTHALLSCFTTTYKSKGLQKAYTKPQLKMLCTAYNVQYDSKANKITLARDLEEAILQSTEVKVPFALNNRELSVSSCSVEDGHVRITISASRSQ